MFAYGLLAVVLVVYLTGIGLDPSWIGVLFTCTMVGDTLVSLYLTTRADRFGRRRTLVIGAGLMFVASVVFASTSSFWALLVAATVGVLSPSGNEIGPFLPVEQSSLTEETDSKRRVTIFALYNLVGYVATALGSFTGGHLTTALQAQGAAAVDSYRVVIMIHGGVALAMAVCYGLLSRHAEVERPSPAGPGAILGLGKARRTVLRLSALFSIDAFAGGFVMQSLLAYWFHVRWGASEAQMGTVLLIGNLCAGASSLLAGRLAQRFGLIHTMVWTHIPSNILLILVPFMPNFYAAMIVLSLRFCLSQMDVPTRQAFVMSVVPAEERSAAGGVTNVARSVGVSLSSLLLGPLFAVPSLGLPLITAGAIKIAYDLALWRACSRVDVKG